MWRAVLVGVFVTLALGCDLPVMQQFSSPLDEKASGFTSHHVTFDANGASGSVPVDTKAYANTALVPVPSTAGGLSLARGTLTGWNTKPDGSGSSASPGGSIPMGGSDLVIYAQWTQSGPYSVTYAYGDGSASGTLPGTVSGLLFNGSTIVGTGSGLLLTNNQFTGWNTRPDGKGTNYVAGNTLTVGHRDLTLYAQWEPTYAVSYDANLTLSAGTVPSDGANRYPLGGSATVLGKGTMDFYGYYFTKWNSRADGMGTNYLPGAALVLGSSDLTLYAQWAQMPSLTWSYQAALSTAVQDINHWHPAWKVTVGMSANGSVMVAGNLYPYLTTNSGASWARANLPASAQNWAGTWGPLAISSDGTKLAVYGFPSNNPTGTYFSTNTGSSWTQGSGTAISSLSMSANGNILWGASSTKTLVSTDLGAGWTSGPSWDQVTDWYSRLVAISGDGNTLYGTYQTGHWYRSRRVAGIWQSKEDMGNSPGNLNALVTNTDGSSVVYTVNDTGASVPATSRKVYRLDLKGWDGSLGAMPAPTAVLPTDHGSPNVDYLWALSASSDGSRVYALANYGAVWLSPDFGLTWAREVVEASLPSFNSGSIATSSDGSKVIVGFGPNVGNVYTGQ